MESYKKIGLVVWIWCFIYIFGSFIVPFFTDQLGFWPVFTTVTIPFAITLFFALRGILGGK